MGDLLSYPWMGIGNTCSMDIRIEEEMKLYNLKHGDHFKIIDEDPRVPPCAPQAEKDKTYWFGNVDGMYSFCKDGDDIVHFAAWTEVEKVDGF